MTYANKNEKWTQNAKIFAYVAKKLYLCTRKGVGLSKKTYCKQ